MADNNVKITFWAKLKNEVSGDFKAMTNGVSSGAKTLAGTFGALGGTASELSGKMGKLASSVRGIYSAFVAMGPVGLVLAGVQAAVSLLTGAIQKAKDKWLQLIQARADNMTAVLQRLKQHLFDIGDAALKKATTEAERATKAFEALATAYLKVAKAKDATAKAGDDAAIAGMRLDKAQAMNAAGNRDAAAVVGADFDVKIAQAELEAVQREAEAAAQRARDEESQNRIRLEAATANEEAAKIALAQAKEDEDFTRDVTGLEEEHKHALQNLVTAEKTLADAVNARVAAQANLDASGEAVKQAELTMAAKLATAGAAVENASRARKELLEAQKEEARRKAEAEAKARQREEEEAKRKADAEAKARQRREYAQMQREAQERLSSTQSTYNDAQRQADASQRQADTAWSWYRSPSAWQSQRQEERDEAKAQRQFAKDFERLQKRQDWRTAQLGDKDELVRRVALAREQAEADQERLKTIQADLANAASALDAIKTTIANGVEL